MQTRRQTTTSGAYDVVVAVDGFASRIGSLGGELGPLFRIFDGSNLLSADVYYRKRGDSALLVLHIDMRCVCGSLLRSIATSSARATCRMVQLNELPAAQRQEFERRLATQYETRVLGIPNPEQAVELLARKLGLVGGRRKSTYRPRGAAQHRLNVRFVRSGCWQGGRVCRLSDSGLYVATGALPRAGDVIDLELSFGSERCVVKASVVQITSSEAASSVGTAGFGARFLYSSRETHARLSRLLRAAGQSVNEIEPPPERREVRYPVQWPARLVHAGGVRAMTAIDVSRRGLFLRGDARQFDRRELEVLFPVDDNAEPVRATARIARTVSAQAAVEQGKTPGIGIELISAHPGDVERYRRFVARVAQRVAHHVVVGSAQARLDSLVASLGAVGYSASGSAQPKSIYAMVANNRPDAVVMDSSLMQHYKRGATLLRSRLTAQRVCTVELTGESATAARSLVDAALNCR